MIRAYQHLLYGFYLWQTRVWRTGGAFNAILLTSIFIFVNTLTVVALLEALCARALLPPLSKTQIFIIYGFLIAAQYVPLFRLGYYQKIIERFSSEPPRTRRVRAYFILAYALLSYVALVGVSVFRGYRLHIVKA